MLDPIKFNGVSIPTGVGITSLVVSTPRVDFRTLDIPNRTGLIRAGKKYGNRAVQLSVVLLGSSLYDNISILADLYAWCQSDGPAPLVIPGFVNTYLLAECDTFPPADLVKSDQEFTVAFSAHNPSFFSNSESSANASQSSFTVGGALPVFPRIEQTLAATVTNPGWILDNGTTISLEGEVDAGALVVDCENEKVTLDGEDITDLVTLDSTLGLTLSPGQHSITGYNGGGGTLKWRAASLWGT